MSPITGTVNKMKNMMGINSFGGTGSSGSVRFVGTSSMNNGLMGKVKNYTNKARNMSASFFHKTQYLAGPAGGIVAGAAGAVVSATKSVARVPAQAVRAMAPKIGGTRAVKTTPKSPMQRAKMTGGSVRTPKPKKSARRPKRQADRRTKRATRQGRDVKKSRGRRPTPRGRVKSISYMVPDNSETINFVGVGGIDS